MRDYVKATCLLQCPDEFHLTVDDVALLTGYSAETIRQRRLRNFPRPTGPGRLLRWRLGDVKAWLISPLAARFEWKATGTRSATSTTKNPTPDATHLGKTQAKTTP